MRVIEEIMEIFCNYDIPTEVIVASVRHPIHVIESARIGADIATVPPEVIRKMVKHPLTDAGIKCFLKDWEKVKK
jgi:transaldolase